MLLRIEEGRKEVGGSRREKTGCASFRLTYLCGRDEAKQGKGEKNHHK